MPVKRQSASVVLLILCILWLVCLSLSSGPLSTYRASPVTLRSELLTTLGLAETTSINCSAVPRLLQVTPQNALSKDPSKSQAISHVRFHVTSNFQYLPSNHQSQRHHLSRNCRKHFDVAISRHLSLPKSTYNARNIHLRSFLSRLDVSLRRTMQTVQRENLFSGRASRERSSLCHCWVYYVA